MAQYHAGEHVKSPARYPKPGTRSHGSRGRLAGTLAEPNHVQLATREAGKNAERSRRLPAQVSPKPEA